MAKQHTVVDTTTLSDGSVVDVFEASVGTSGAVGWQKWDTCVICGFSYPVSGIAYVNGKPYCTRFRHDREIPGSGGIKES